MLALYCSTTAWIGLQKTLADHTWNIGGECQSRPVVYRGWNSITEDNTKTAYAFSTTGTWPNLYSTSTTSAAICRLGTAYCVCHCCTNNNVVENILDRNICGRNNGCPSCSTCTPTNNGKCYSCGPLASSTAVTANATATSTTSKYQSLW